MHNILALVFISVSGDQKYLELTTDKYAQLFSQ